MTATWVALDQSQDEVIRFVADRNDPDRGTVIVICTLSIRTPQALATAVLGSLAKQTKPTFAPQRARSWSLAEIWVRTWSVSHIVLVGAHRLRPGLIAEAATFAERVEADVTFVTTGRVRPETRIALNAAATTTKVDEFLEQLDATPIVSTLPIEVSVSNRQRDCFETARQRALVLLVQVPSGGGWFVDIDPVYEGILDGIVQDLAVDDPGLVEPAARGVLVGLALQGWRWSKRDGPVGYFARQRGAEPWAALEQYREPSSACAVALCALDVDPWEACALTDADVAPDGSEVRLERGSIVVASPHARRALRALRAQVLLNEHAGVGQFLQAHGQALSVSTVVDTVRRSLGVLGVDLVT